MVVLSWDGYAAVLLVQQEQKHRRMLFLNVECNLEEWESEQIDSVLESKELRNKCLNNLTIELSTWNLSCGLIEERDEDGERESKEEMQEWWIVMDDFKRRLECSSGGGGQATEKPAESVVVEIWKRGLKQVDKGCSNRYSKYP